MKKGLYSVRKAHCKIKSKIGVIYENTKRKHTWMNEKEIKGNSEWT